jgi:hypothetical protein
VQILRDKSVVLPIGGQDVTRALELLLKERRVDQVHSALDFDPLVVESIKVGVVFCVLVFVLHLLFLLHLCYYYIYLLHLYFFYIFVTTSLLYYHGFFDVLRHFFVIFSLSESFL